MTMYLRVSHETPKLTALRKALANTESINRKIADHMLREIDRNIVEQGIWEGWKWAAPKVTTTYARVARGKDARPLFGLRGRFGSKVGKTSISLFSTSEYAKLMQEGPKKKSWTITPKRKMYLSFPHPQGEPRKGFGGLWAIAKKVHHKGWPKRRLMPPLDEIGYTARLFVGAAIKGAIK